MEPASHVQRERRRTTDNRFTACHVDNPGNLHIVNQLQPNQQRTTTRPHSQQPGQVPQRNRTTRVKTVRFSLEGYSNSARSSTNKPLPSFFQLGTSGAVPKPLPQIPASTKPPLTLEGNTANTQPRKPPTPPPKDHFAQVLECKRVSIQRLKTPKPHRLTPLLPQPVIEEEDVVAIVKVYRPPRRVRIHWLRVLKDHQQRKWAFPIVLILVPTGTRNRKMPNRISKVLVVGQGRRPGSYKDAVVVDPDCDDGKSRGGERERLTLEADLDFNRRPKSTPEGRRPPRPMGMRDDDDDDKEKKETRRRVSNPDWLFPHPGTKWME